MRRYIWPGEDAAVWIESGRWGPKRVKVSQCWAALRAEDVYTGLLRDDAKRARPGARGVLSWTLAGEHTFEVAWELRANTVWRFGRVFLTCPACNRRATRIYVPGESFPARCRRCWGLSYESRQRRNYKAGRSRWGVILSPLTYAMCRAEDAREARSAASLKRYAERREILKHLSARRCRP